MELSIEQVTLDDIADLLTVQRAAFKQQAEIYVDCCLPPLMETEEMVKEELAHRKILKAVVGDRLVGSVRAELMGDVCHIERLSVSPLYMRRGIGLSLMQAVENLFPDVKLYSLFTGHKSIRSICFYKKLGYKIVRKKKAQVRHGSVPLVFMDKRASGRRWATFQKIRRFLLKQ